MRSGVIGAGLAVLALGGCDDSFEWDVVDTDEEYFEALQDETIALRNQVEFLDVTDIAAIPLAGSATYEGTALISLDTTSASEIIGEASITADFTTDIVSGEMTDFYGTVDGAAVTEFDGDITVSKGLIDLTDTNQVATKVDGTLVGGGDVLDVNATLEGNFLGDPALLDDPPEALQLDSSDESIFTLNGDEVGGGMQVIGVLD